MQKKIVIVGATSTIAELCAREWIIQKNIEMILVGRNIKTLEAIAQDLKIRGFTKNVKVTITDFKDPISIKKVVDNICSIRTPDVVLIAHGALPDQQECQRDLILCKETMEINGISPALFAEAFALHMDKANAGTLAIIGSVAGDRGRRTNYTYGAAKGLVASYAHGLQHRFYGRNIKIVLIKPGPTETKMTMSLKKTGAKFANAHDVASEIVKGITRGTPVIYTPRKWKILMIIIRNLPNFIFGKVKI
jgi:short-subunit dehydrogenase